MDPRLSGGISGAAQGASAGAAFGPWGAAIGGIIGGGLGVFSGNSAREAERRRRAIIDEQARRLQAEHDRTISLAQASGAASGIEYDSGSLQTALTTMTNEFRAQEDLFRKTGYQEIADANTADGWNAFGDLMGGVFSTGANLKRSTK